MDAFSIEPITESDIDELLKIADECGLSPWTRQNFIDELSRDDSIMLLTRNGPDRTVGFVVGRIILGDSEAEIYNIGVTEGSRRLGIAKTLLAEFLKRGKRAGVESVWLEVRSLNAGAIAFYEENGFQARAKRRNFYSNPVDDAILMERDI
jgi:[ribosomal protein S18]-alanine N-acetyltransferase